ncbi:hypothetical protein IGI04_038672 [Brassica rapa subsp. trilocularis]|uniref:Uncharacterized protein n=1 Tax=Brassica rapa subsp. trilocularis TaxID=1813537 RepID=A0ABQ7LKY2_BRACM|nr:hypothetical protein IGI04_038672 [Brassica rapa subsp. trilocularis]
MSEMNGVPCSSRPMRIGPAASKKGVSGQRGFLQFSQAYLCQSKGVKRLSNPSISLQKKRFPPRSVGLRKVPYDAAGAMASSHTLASLVDHSRLQSNGSLWKEDMPCLGRCVQ